MLLNFRQHDPAFFFSSSLQSHTSPKQKVEEVTLECEEGVLPPSPEKLASIFKSQWHCTDSFIIIIIVIIYVVSIKGTRLHKWCAYGKRGLEKQNDTIMQKHDEANASDTPYFSNTRPYKCNAYGKKVLKEQNYTYTKV